MSDFVNVTRNNNDIISTYSNNQNDEGADEGIASLVVSLAQIATQVTKYGAKGDGVTDDTVAIQAAIDYVYGLGGGKVLLPPQTFLFSSDIIVKSNVSLVGANKHKTILKSTANGCKIYVQDATNVVLENFTLDANNKATRISVQAVNANVQNITINHVIVKNSGTVSDSTTWNNNIQVKRWGSYYVKDVWLTNLYCENAAGDGTSYGDNLILESYGSDGSGTLTNVIIENCIFKKAGRQNISIAGDITTSKPSKIVINNVICEDSSLAGIDIEEGDEVSIQNVHFVNSGKYTAFYNGTHFAQRNPNSIMRSAVAVHNDNNVLISNCTFNACNFGIGGYGNGLVVSNSKFFDSKITNGDLSSAGRWLFSNCEINGSGLTDYLVDCFMGRLKFINCNFLGTTTSAYMVRLLGASSALTDYRGNSFEHCGFTGQTDLSMNAFYIQYGWYDIKNCLFSNIGTVFRFYQSQGLVNANIQGNQIITANTIVDSDYISLSSLNFSNNYCESVKKVAKFNTQVRDLKVVNNTFKLKFDTGDGVEHIAFGNATAVPGVRSLIFSNNYCINNGTATDVQFLRVDIKSVEVSTDMVKITNNMFKSLNKAFGIYLYSGGTAATSAIITGNEGKSVTTFIDSYNGLDVNKAIVKDNLSDGVLVNVVFPRISGTTALRPTNVLAGYSYYDTTLNKPISYNGTAWTDSTGTAV